MPIIPTTPAEVLRQAREALALNADIDPQATIVERLAKTRAALAAIDALPSAPSGEPAEFDAEGFRAWVAKNLPDDTIIGGSAWWADHLTQWAKRFAARGAAPQAATASVAGLAEYTPGSWYQAATVDDMRRFYLSRLPAIREAAQAHGYAIGLHGSERRDFDLIAVPWRDGAADADTLAHAIAQAACGIDRAGAYEWEAKPAGRIATSLPICWTAWHDMIGAGHIDLSVVGAAPQAAPVPAPSDDLERMTERRDELRRALEIIAVGDASNPQQQAAEELIALGYWRDIPEARASSPAAAAPEPVAAKYLFIQMDDDNRAWHRWCADAAEVREAVKAAMFFLPEGEELSADHAEQLDGSVEELMDSGALTFEGDQPLYLYRMALNAWTKAPPAHPAPAVAATVRGLNIEDINEAWEASDREYVTCFHSFAAGVIFAERAHGIATPAAPKGQQ